MNCKHCGKTVFVKETCSCGETAPDKNGGKVLLNNIICIVIMVGAVLALILSVSLRYIVNNDLLAETVKDTDLTQIEVRDDSGEKVPLDKWVYDKYIDDDRITVKNVDNVLNNPFIKDFLIEKIHGYQDFFMDEGEIVTVTSQDIVDLIDKNSDLLYREAGLNFLEPDKDDLRKNLEGLDDFADFSKEHLSGWFLSSYIQTYFSLAYVIFLTVLLGIILAQWLLVYRFNGRRMLRAMRNYGIVMIIPSAVVFVLTLVPMIVFYSSSAFDALPIGKLFAPFCVSSGILLALGLILLVASIIAARLLAEKTEAPESAVNGVSDTADDTAMETTDAVTDNTEFAPVSGFAEPVMHSPEEKCSDEVSDSTWAVKEDQSVWARPEPAEEKTPVSPVSLEKPKESKPADTEPKPKKEFVFCTKCGKQNRAGSRFCSGCGNKLRN